MTCVRIPMSCENAILRGRGTLPQWTVFPFLHVIWGSFANGQKGPPESLARPTAATWIASAGPQLENFNLGPCLSGAKEGDREKKTKTFSRIATLPALYRAQNQENREIPFSVSKNTLRAKGTLISEPRFSAPCEMRFFFPTRERKIGLRRGFFFEKAVFPFSRWKNRISQGVENRGSLISVRLALRENTLFHAPLRTHLNGHFQAFNSPLL